MTTKTLVILQIFTLLIVSILPIRAHAGDGSEEFTVGSVIGDGKSGRRFAKWSQKIAEKNIDSVTVFLRKQSGGDDTYVNLRFGDGATFENGRRVYLRDNGEQDVTWRVGGKTPQGLPLVLNAYNGEVAISRVVVSYARGSESTSGDRSSEWDQDPRGPNSSYPRPPLDNNYDNRYDDSRNPDRYGNDNRYGDNRYDNDNRYGNNNGYSHGQGYSNSNRPNDSAAAEYCRDPRKRIRRPQIEISEIEPTGGLFSGKYKVRGSIFGQCVEEAGYYESGRLKEEIQVPYSDRADRIEFKVKARSGQFGEIRVYTTDGSDDSIDIDQEIQSYQQRYQSGGVGGLQIPFGR